MPLPYTPDRPLDEPNDDEPREKEKCDFCLEPFEDDDLSPYLYNLKPLILCEACIKKLEENDN